ncbi:MAG: polyketide synthase [Planctomycetota bacterium]
MPSLDPKLRTLLDDVRRRIRRYVIWDSLLAVAAIVLAAFWMGLLVDYLPVTVGGSEMPRSARTLLLFVVGIVVLVVVARLLLSRLGRPLPDESLALLLERQHPELEGRLVTAVELSRAGRSHDSHAPELLQLVHDQASQKSSAVQPARIFRGQPLIRKALVAGPLLLLLLVFAFASPSAFALAAKRLMLFSDNRWPRRASLEMVGVDVPVVTASSEEQLDPARLVFEDGVMKLPVGSSGILRIRAAAETAEVPSVCTVYYRTDDGTRGQSNMRRVGRMRDGYQSFVLDGPPLSNLNESFEFSVLGLDDRLTDFRIEAVEPPAITGLDVGVRYPDYLRAGSATEGLAEGFDSETQYQAGLRISEGSDVTLRLASSLPVGDIDAVMESGGVEQVISGASFSEDRRSFELKLVDFRSPTAIRIVPRNPDGISAQSPYRYFLGAIIDEPPSVSLALRGIQSAVTPVAMLPLEANTTDDYAVTSLDAFVASQPAAAEDMETEQGSADQGSAGRRKIISRKMTPDRDGDAQLVMDLRQLTNDGVIEELRPGDVVQVYAEAEDGFDLDGAMHVTSSEIFRLQVVSAEELLALLERRELGLRTRLEQTVTETQGLRDQLAKFQAAGFDMEFAPGEEDTEQARSRQLQVLRLRVQQSSLQVSKTTEELTGIAESLDDLLQEMVNNRIDSTDRQERLGSGVRDPLRQIVSASMPKLKSQVEAIEASVSDPETATARTGNAIQTADQVLLELTAVLDKMLDLESYNELLDLVRGLIQDQEKLKEDTQQERKNRVKDLFR